MDDIVINSSNEGLGHIDELDVRPNDSKVLDVLSENNSNYTFRGMMRKLGMHQESLSRSLQRLHELDLIEKSQLGYRLSEKGAFLAKDDPKLKISYTPLLQTYVPSNIHASDIISNMAGRWFKNLRWIGMVESQTDHVLQWLGEFGSFDLNLRVSPNYITIESSATSEKDKADAMISAYRIIQEVSKLYGSQYGSFSTNPNNKSN
ncbi:MAG: ArsR family transcriptional regulator [Thaumarchaeota archaeon]|nr:ArsR family transcriptional regulator [Nitrososphaerota archaeon]MBI3641636.1 ArsR family transcriptional regulator [Nitrososphaerota archaeon]